MQQRYVKTSSYCISNFFIESRESCLAADGRAWKVDGRVQALVGPGLATPLVISVNIKVLCFGTFPGISQLVEC